MTGPGDEERQSTATTGEPTNINVTPEFLADQRRQQEARDTQNRVANFFGELWRLIPKEKLKKEAPKP